MSTIIHAPLRAVTAISSDNVLTLSCGHTVSHRDGTGRQQIRCPYCPGTVEVEQVTAVKGERERLLTTKERKKLAVKEQVRNDAPDLEGTKVCSKCGEEKPRKDFYKYPRAADGLFPACKACYQAGKGARSRAKANTEAPEAGA